VKTKLLVALGLVQAVDKASDAHKDCMEVKQVSAAIGKETDEGDTKPVPADKSDDGKWVKFMLVGDVKDDTRWLWVAPSDTLEKWSKSIADAYDVEESSLEVHSTFDSEDMMPDGKFADYYDKKDIDDNDVSFEVHGYAGNELQRDFQDALFKRCRWEPDDLSPEVADFMLERASSHNKELICCVRRQGRKALDRDSCGNGG